MTPQVAYGVNLFRWMGRTLELRADGTSSKPIENNVFAFVNSEDKHFSKTMFLLHKRSH